MDGNRRFPLSPLEMRVFLAARDDVDLARIHYCYQIGSTFLSLALMEEAFTSAMSICDIIKVKDVLGADAKDWEEMLRKRDFLRSSTLGNLVRILSAHGIGHDDLRYLRWLKEKRDHFVHRYFQLGGPSTSMLRQ